MRFVVNLSGRASVRAIRAFGAVAMVMAITACASIPKVAREVQPLGSHDVGIAAADVPTQQVPVLGAWWTALGDPQLDRIMADSLAGNPSLEATIARLRQAQQSIAVQRAGLLPQADADVSEQYQRFSERYIIPPPYGGTSQWLGSAQGNLSLALDLAGRQRALIAQARGLAAASALDSEAARVTLTGSVAQTYVDLARATRQSALASRFVQSREQSLRIAQVRKRAGLGNDFEIRSADTLLAEARQARVRADGARETMVHALAALAGRGADYYAGIATPTIDLDKALPLPTALPADLLGRRADILAARARIDAADANRRVARADFFPNIDLRAFVGPQAIGLSHLISGGAFTFGVGPALHLPIFAGGRLSAQYRGASAAVDEAAANYNDIVVRAVRDAADALSAVRTNIAAAAEQRAILIGEQQTVHLDQVRLRTGLGAQLDVLSSGNRLLQANQTATDLAADGAIRRVQLLIAIGGSFDPAPYAAADVSSSADLERKLTP